MAQQTKYLAGLCPKCGKDLEYGASEPDGETLSYEVHCPNKACGFSGAEIYSLTFTGFIESGTFKEFFE